MKKFPFIVLFVFLMGLMAVNAQYSGNNNSNVARTNTTSNGREMNDHSGRPRYLTIGAVGLGLIALVGIAVLRMRKKRDV